MKICLGSNTFNIKEAKSIWSRFLGLMFKRNIEKNEGMIIYDCNWVHTFFMNFNLDIIYLNSELKVIDYDINKKPWRICKPRIKSKHVLELHAGSFSGVKGEELKCLG